MLFWDDQIFCTNTAGEDTADPGDQRGDVPILQV